MERRGVNENGVMGGGQNTKGFHNRAQPKTEKTVKEKRARFFPQNNAEVVAQSGSIRKVLNVRNIFHKKNALGR